MARGTRTPAPRTPAGASFGYKPNARLQTGSPKHKHIRAMNSVIHSGYDFGHSVMNTLGYKRGYPDINTL